MDLINAHGMIDGVFPAPFFHPGTIGPGKAGEVGGDGGGAGAEFRQKCEGVCLKQYLSTGSGDGEFVQLSLLHAWYKELPDSGSRQRIHGMGFGVPSVKISGQVDCLGMRSPDGKVVALSTLPCFWVGSQLFEDFIVCSCTEKIPVQLCDEAGFTGSGSSSPGFFWFCVFFGVSVG